MMKLVYPALFTPWDDGHGYTVEVPDLPGCVTEGADLAAAIAAAEDAASGWLLLELEEGNDAPAASDIHAFHPEGGGFVSLLTLDMEAYAEKYGSAAVRKNCTIPAWLNTFAEGQHINFSKVLSDGLTALYQKAHPSP